MLREFPLPPDTLLTALERPFVRRRKGKVGERGGGSLQTDRDDVPRGCSTGQVFIAGSFVQIPLLINDYPNSMIDRQYRWLVALPRWLEFISYSTDDLIVEDSSSARLVICRIFCEITLLQELLYNSKQRNLNGTEFIDYVIAIIKQAMFC